MIIYLYHKRHKITGLNYFGKTNRDPYIYKGSGVYWSRHLKKHGTDIETVQVWEFTDLDECSKFAIDFSVEHNIVQSSEWANLIVENGHCGGNNPCAHTPEARQKRKNTLSSKDTPPPNNNTPAAIEKANASRAATFAKKKEAGLKHRGLDTKPRTGYVRSKPFVNRNTPESLAKRRETLAKKKLLSLSNNLIN